MNSIEYLRRLFDYDHWANRTALESIGTIPLGEDANGAARKLFSHVIQAERVWLARFEECADTVSPWADLDISEGPAAVEEVYQRWMRVLDGLSPETLVRDLVYRNTKGVEFHTPIQDLLVHMVTHSAYHRGQVAIAVREAGGKPAPSDYVVYVRQLIAKQARQAQ